MLQALAAHGQLKKKCGTKKHYVKNFLMSHKFTVQLEMKNLELLYEECKIK